MGKFSALEKVQLTKDWTLEERSAFAHFLEELEVSEGERIFESASQKQMLFLIEKGQVNLTLENTEIELKAGESFSELSIIEGTQKLPVATALTDCVFWVLSAEHWVDMKKAAPVISLKLLENICAKLVKTLSSNFRPHRVLAKLSVNSTASNRLPIDF